MSRSRSDGPHVRFAASKCHDCNVFIPRSGSGMADVRLATDLHPPRCKSSSAFSVHLIHIFLRNCISISTCSGCRTPGCPISTNPRMELAPQKHGDMLRSLPSGGLVCSVVIRVLSSFVPRSCSERSYVRLAASKCTDCPVFRPRSGSGRADVRFATNLKTNARKT